jgi:hypothetical protein
MISYGCSDFFLKVESLGELHVSFTHVFHWKIAWTIIIKVKDKSVDLCSFMDYQAALVESTILYVSLILSTD